MKKIHEVVGKKDRPVKVIQFGDGVFLRGFFDWMLQEMNDQGLFEGSVAVVKPTPSKGRTAEFMAQKCLYTNVIRGLSRVETQVVDVIDRIINPYEEFQAFLDLAKLPQVRFVVSNTTEAGIVDCPTDGFGDQPPSSFPAKLTRLLYERFTLGLSGFWILPCELIEGNGNTLRDLVLAHGTRWGLGQDFFTWVTEQNVFCNTLVDRIVSGFPSDANLSYEDPFANGAEPFHFWAIEGGEGLFGELPLDQAGFHVLLTKDITPYRERKVRILNGAHTAMVCYGLNLGLKTVEECMKHETISSFVSDYIVQEVMDTVPLPREECESFWEAVQERFLNPYLQHALSAISLNSISKFRVRVLPVILERERQGKEVTKGLMAWKQLIDWYKNGTPRDDKGLIEAIRQGSVVQILSNASLWGGDYSRFAKEMEQ